MFFKQISQLVESLVQDKFKDIRTEGLSNLNTLFGTLVATAKIPEKGDPSATMGANIKEARIKFPLTTKATEERNKQIISTLENAAKRAEQREIQKK
jgi:GTPase involved in cell partitioning and DNA repair